MKIWTQKEVIVKGQSYTDGNTLKWVTLEDANKLQRESAELIKLLNIRFNCDVSKEGIIQ